MSNITSKSPEAREKWEEIPLQFSDGVQSSQNFDFCIHKLKEMWDNKFKPLNLWYFVKKL